MRFGPAVPILRSFDETEAREFCLRNLGFEPLFEPLVGPGLPRYVGVKRDDGTLHPSKHHGDATPGSAMRIEVADVEGVLAEPNRCGHPRMRPGIETQPWGAREIELTEPFGNRVLFWQEAAL